MFGFMLLFVLLAIIAGYFGFIILAGTAAWVAKTLFLLAVITMLIRGVREAANGQPPV